MLSPREAVCTLPSYHPPLAGREGLRLDFNENTVGCSPRVLEKLQRMTADDFTKYPERQAVVRGYTSLAGFAKSQVNQPSR